MGRVVPAVGQIPVQEGDGGRHVGDEAFQQLLLLGERELGVLALGHVPDDGEHEPALSDAPGNGAQGELEVELAARLMPARQLHGALGIDEASMARLAEAAHPREVHGLVAFGHQEGDGLSDRFCGGIAEQVFGHSVPEHDAIALHVGDHDGVPDVVEEQPDAEVLHPDAIRSRCGGRALVVSLRASAHGCIPAFRMPCKRGPRA
ncbi:hypothetical protein D3C86_1293650 [compost metagenome]